MSTKVTTDTEKLGLLAGTLLFIVSGLRHGSITSKPIILQSDDAEEYPIVTLESEIWKALNKCGITEKSPTKKGKK